MRKVFKEMFTRYIEEREPIGEDKDDQPDDEGDEEDKKTSHSSSKSKHHDHQKHGIDVIIFSMFDVKLILF